MLKGYTLPRTPRGTSSLAPTPPWHYVGTALAVEFETGSASAAAFLPDGLDLHSGRCAAYFVEWQWVSEQGVEYLDPITSQYHETIILLSASFEGSPVAYCPFIWVDQDVSLMRGLVQGWPKQIGATWITRAYDLPSKARLSLPRRQVWGNAFGERPSVDGSAGNLGRAFRHPSLAEFCPSRQHAPFPRACRRQARPSRGS